MMPVTLGLDRLRSNPGPLRGKRFGLVCNQASIGADCRHILEAFFPRHGQDFEIGAVFGPQHGLWGHTQDNMIEWEGFRDPVTGLPIYSLYGEHRKPTPAMLDGLDLVVFDVPEVGARYYTFIWTLLYVMEACAEQGIPVIVLDRPNPIGADLVEGNAIEAGFESFVGLKSMPNRHGMTMGELAQMFRDLYVPKVELEVVPMEDYNRAMPYGETGLPWAMPSPNMPTPDTALVYPGQCLLEGTLLSEGRGTTRPFEMFGAPFIDGRRFCDQLNREGLPGCFFRPVAYAPTFQKHHGQLCEGAHIHVTDPRAFRPVLTTLVLLSLIQRLYPEQLKWQSPPYEYEYKLLPFDILSGSESCRHMIERGASKHEFAEYLDLFLTDFTAARKTSMLY